MAGGAYLRGTHLVSSGRLREGLGLMEQAWVVADRLDDTAQGMICAAWRAARATLLDDPADARAWAAREAVQARQSSASK